MNVKGQLSPSASSRRRENAQSGVVYRTRTVLRILSGLQIINSLCFARKVILKAASWSLPRNDACKQIIWDMHAYRTAWRSRLKMIYFKILYCLSNKYKYKDF